MIVKFHEFLDEQFGCSLKAKDDHCFQLTTNLIQPNRPRKPIRPTIYLFIAQKFRTFRPSLLIDALHK
jgi:hypothetical protein